MKRAKRPTNETNQIVDASGDRKYFILTPRIVWAFSRNPYDLTLWIIIKDIAGEHGQCTMETSNLATLAMMSAGQVQDSREYLLAVGLLLGRLYREQHYTNPVWHLTVPDLWRPNVEWSQQFASIQARLLFKAQQKAAVKKVWERYKLTKAQRKADGRWDYDRETTDPDLLDLGEIGLIYRESEMDSPGESVVKQSEMDSLHVGTDSPGVGADSLHVGADSPGERAPTPGERKKIIKKNDDDAWMNEDPICQFLRTLPGYNPTAIRADRLKIVDKYDAAELPYLWADAQEKSTSNPIGLFLMMCDSGQHSAAYLEARAAERAEADRRQKLAEEGEPEPITYAPAPQPAPLVIDPSVTQPLAGTRMTPVQVWQAAQGELQLQMTRATYDTWVKPADVISVNGTWKIAVPTQYAKEWWDTRMTTTLQRILHGIVGQPCEPEFVVIRRGEA